MTPQAKSHIQIQVEEHRMKVNGITLHVRAAGPEKGPLIIFLHGFPEDGTAWRNQVQYFAKKGYRVIIPDQRGYNLSDKPKGIASYHIQHLVSDVIGLIDKHKRKTAYVVGHDWGGIVAWWLSILYPQRLKKVVILNVPHPAVIAKNLQTNPNQLLKSWYVLFFQLPWLPEMVWRLTQGKLGIRGLLTSLPGTFSPTDFETYKRAWSQPGAISSMINWYRAPRHLGRLKKKLKTEVETPFLILWGAQDAFLSRKLADESLDYCKNGRLVFFEDATHWIQHERPEKVNPLVREFFRNS